MRRSVPRHRKIAAVRDEGGVLPRPLARPWEAGGRSSGTLLDAALPGLTEHVCWGYTSVEDRDATARAWLDAGSRRQQRLVFVAHDEPGAQVQALLASVPACGDMPPVAVHRIRDVYDLARPIDPAAQLAAFSIAVRQALDDGYAGVRIFADMTQLIVDPGRRPSHVRWEHAVDRFMAAGNPLSMLCAYDLTVVGAAPRAVVAVHPLRNTETGPLSFALYGTRHGCALEGEVDVFTSRVLERALAALPDEPVDLDLGRLAFIDGHAAAALARVCAARSTAAPIRLKRIPEHLRQLWELLDLGERSGCRALH